MVDGKLEVYNKYNERFLASKVVKKGNNEGTPGLAKEPEADSIDSKSPWALLQLATNLAPSIPTLSFAQVDGNVSDSSKGDEAEGDRTESDEEGSSARPNSELQIKEDHEQRRLQMKKRKLALLDERDLLSARPEKRSSTFLSSTWGHPFTFSAGPKIQRPCVWPQEMYTPTTTIDDELRILRDLSKFEKHVEMSNMMLPAAWSKHIPRVSIPPMARLPSYPMLPMPERAWMRAMPYGAQEPIMPGYAYMQVPSRMTSFRPVARGACASE